ARGIDDGQPSHAQHDVGGVMHALGVGAAMMNGVAHPPQHFQRRDVLVTVGGSAGNSTHAASPHTNLPCGMVLNIRASISYSLASCSTTASRRARAMIFL